MEIRKRINGGSCEKEIKRRRRRNKILWVLMMCRELVQ